MASEVSNDHHPVYTSSSLVVSLISNLVSALSPSTAYDHSLSQRDPLPALALRQRGITMTQTSASTSSSSAAQPRPAPLYIFTTTQSPLVARYPRPAKANLIVPPLVHRSLHLALDQTPPSLHANADAERGGVLIIPHPDQLRKHAPDHDEIEVTLKIHLVGDASAAARSGWVLDALELLDRHLGLKGADTMLVGFKGVDYKGKKTVSGDNLPNGDATGPAGSKSELVPPSEYSVSPEDEQHIVDFWSDLTRGLSRAERQVKRVGTMYLPLGVLKRLKQIEGGLDVEVNSLDTPDCHHLPQDYTGWARENKVQLWAGGGGEGSGQSAPCVIISSSTVRRTGSLIQDTDPLPSAELHNILQEFASHLPDQSGRPLSQLIPLDPQGQWDTSARRGVAVRWVMGYTVVSSSRNVVEDKG